MKKVLCVSILLAMAASASFAAVVTGNPVADGWTLNGNSLANGVYVRSSANYGFNTYSAAITVMAGSNLAIDDGAKSWLAGDTVLGLGGTFANITASEAGWSAFSGNAVNAILADSTKMVAKFGTDNATYSASTIAPGAGNGGGSTSLGGTGTVFMRTSGWNYVANWSAGSGILASVVDPGHITREGGSIDKSAGRIIWIWDGVAGHVASWQMLLNVSLVDRLDPTFAGLTPAAGNTAIMSVQNRDAAYTDALVTVVPEPATMCLLAIGAMGMLRKRSAK